MKRHLKNLFVITATAFGILFALNLVIDNPYTHRFLRAVINKMIDKHSTVSISFEAMSVSVLPLRVDLYGLKVQQDETDADRDLARIAHLKATVSIWSLMVDRPKLSLVQLENLTVIWPPKGGVDSLLHDPQPPSNMENKESLDSPKWRFPDIPVESISISNGQFFVAAASPINLMGHPNTKLITTMAGVNLDLDLLGEGKANGSLTIGRLNAVEGNRSLIENAAVGVDLAARGRQFALRNLQLVGERVSLDGHLTIDVQVNPREVVSAVTTHGSLGVEGDLSTLGSFLEFERTRGFTRAQVDTHLHIPVTADEAPALEIAGPVRISDGFLAGYRLYDIASDVKIDLSGISLSDATVELNGAELLTASGHLDFNESISYDFTGRTAQLPFSDLMRALDVHVGVIDFTAHDSPLRVQGTGAPFQMDVTAKPNLTRFIAPHLVQDAPDLRSDTHSPCSGQLNIHIDAKKLSFEPTTLRCASIETPSLPPTPDDSSESEVPDDGLSKITSATELEISGTVNFARQRMDLAILSPDFDLSLAGAAIRLDLDGLGSVRTTISGPWDEIVTAVDLDIRDATFQTIELGRITGQISAVHGVVSWQRIGAAHPLGLEVTLKEGSYDVGQDHITTSFDVAKISQTDMNQILYLLGGTEFGFGLEYWGGSIDGKIKTIGQAKIDSKIELSALSYQDHAIVERIGWHILKEPGLLKVDDIEIKHGTFRATSQFSIYPAVDTTPNAIADNAIARFFGLTGNELLDLELKTYSSGTGLDLQNIPIAGSYLKLSQLNGDLDTSISVSGPLSQLQGTIDGETSTSTILGANAPPVRFIGFYDQGHLDLTFNHGGNTLEGRLKMNLLAPGVPYEWFINMDDFDLRAFFTEFFYKDPRNYAYMQGKWYMNGEMTNWLDSRGSLQVEQIQWKYVHEKASKIRKIHMVNREPATLLFNDDGWVFKDHQDLELISEHVYSKISLPNINYPQSFTMDIHSEIQLELLAHLLKNIESATGKIVVGTKISGPLTDLGVHIASNSLPEREAGDPISINVSDMRPRFSDIEYQLVYSEGILNIEKLSAKKGGGNLASKGLVNINGPESIDSNLTTTFKDIKLDYYLPYLKKFDTILDGDVLLSGKSPPYRLTGDINIVRARSSRQFDVREEVVKALRRDTIAALTSTAQSSEPLLLFDLAVKGDRSISINNQNLKLTVSNDLKIGGDLQKPTILGNILINKGRFNYRREFDILRGEIIFDDPVKMDPKIDILAATEVSAYRVTVSATGTASQPIIELLVDPPTRDDGSVITRLDAIILLSRGSLPDNEQQTAQSQGVGVSELLTIYSSQLPIEQIFETYGQSFQPYLDWTTDEKGSPVVQLNVRFNIIEGIGGVYSRRPTQNKLSLEIPVHEGISSSLNQTFTSGNSEEASTHNEGSFDLRFRFSFD